MGPENKAPTVLVCRHFDSGEQLYSQELDTGLIYLLLWARWLDDDLKPTAKVLAAAKKGDGVIKFVRLKEAEVPFSMFALPRRIKVRYVEGQVFLTLFPADLGVIWLDG